MTVGVRSVRTAVWLFPEASAAATVDAVVAAEDAGIDELWLGDEGPGRDPFSVLAAAAQRTERITLGVSVTNPYLRHPAVTAATAMTVNELSGGRFVLGLGPGGGMALDPVGVVRERPLTRTRDALRVIRAVAGTTSDRRVLAAVARPPRSTAASGDRRARREVQSLRIGVRRRRLPRRHPAIRAAAPRSNGPAACGRSTSASTSTPSPTSASSSTCARRSSGRWPTLPRLTPGPAGHRHRPARRGDQPPAERRRPSGPPGGHR